MSCLELSEAPSEVLRTQAGGREQTSSSSLITHTDGQHFFSALDTETKSK